MARAGAGTGARGLDCGGSVGPRPRFCVRFCWALPSWTPTPWPCPFRYASGGLSLCTVGQRHVVTSRACRTKSVSGPSAPKFRFVASGSGHSDPNGPAYPQRRLPSEAGLSAAQPAVPAGLSGWFADQEARVPWRGSARAFSPRGRGRQARGPVIGRSDSAAVRCCLCTAPALHCRSLRASRSCGQRPRAVFQGPALHN